MTARASRRRCREIIQTIARRLQGRLHVNAVSIEDAAPPREVADAFDEVQRAEQDEDKFVEQAQPVLQHSSSATPAARRHRSAKTRPPTRTASCRKPKARPQRFISVYDEYAKAPDVTRKRLYLETMEKVLKGSNKVIVEQGNRARASCPICRCRHCRRNRRHRPRRAAGHGSVTPGN